MEVFGMSPVTWAVRCGLILALLSGVSGCLAQQQLAQLPAAGAKQGVVDTWVPDDRQRAILASLPADAQGQRDELLRLVRIPLPSEQDRLRLVHLLGHGFPDDHPLRGNESVLMDLMRMQERPSQQELNEFVVSLKKRMLHMKGGRFIMGDFGPMKFKDGLTITGQANNPAHPVELSSYSIMKGRVTFAEWDLYLRAQDKGILSWIEGAHARSPLVGVLDHRSGYTAWPINWTEADGYCRWLKDITGQPFALPTEAQWEFAAREGGKFISHPMHHLPGIQWGNTFVPTTQSADEGMAAVKKAAGAATPFIRPRPTSLTGENRIGMQGVVGGNEVEWTGDRYAEDPRVGSKLLKDPVGAVTGPLRSVRAVAGNWSNSVLHRYGHEETRGHHFRCVLNSRQPWR